MKLAVVLVCLIYFFVPTFGNSQSILLSDIGASSRMIALGNIEGASDSANSIFENVALMNNVNKYSISMFTANLMEEVDFKHFAVAYRLPIGVLGVGAITSGVNDIPYTQKVGDRLYQIGNFGVSTTLGKLGYAFSLSEENFLGLTLDYYQQNIADVNGNGINLSMGYSQNTDNFDLSISLKNIVSSSKVNYSNGNNETNPFQFITSVSYGFDELRVFAQYKTQSEKTKSLISTAIHYHPKFLSIIDLFFGYKQYYELQDINNNYSIGLDLNLIGVTIGYTMEFTDHIAFDNYNFLTCSLNI